MIDSTRVFFRNEIEKPRHFSPRWAVPQALQKGRAVNDNGAARVGKSEVRDDRVTNVSNHPQSLWISLWVPSQRVVQVTNRKGFFFLRSKFERSEFGRCINALRKFCPARFYANIRLPGHGREIFRAVDSTLTRFHGRRTLSRSPTSRFRLSYDPTS
jgi:hypothetical protein